MLRPFAMMGFGNVSNHISFLLSLCLLCMLLAAEAWLRILRGSVSWGISASITKLLQWIVVEIPLVGPLSFRSTDAD